MLEVPPRIDQHRPQHTQILCRHIIGQFIELLWIETNTWNEMPSEHGMHTESALVDMERELILLPFNLELLFSFHFI